MQIGDFSDQKVLIVGLSREGWSTLTYLRSLPTPPTSITLTDTKTLEQLATHWQQLSTDHPTIEFQLADTYLSNWQDFDVIVKSAGVSPYQDPWPEIEAHPAVTITSNTELFLHWASTQSDLTTIGITGTKGKSTTSSLIAHVLRENELPTVLGGNVGTPCLDLIPQLKDLVIDPADHIRRYAVLELSSHQTRQLAYTPNVVVLQAFAPEHLDYYPDVDTYYQAKADLLTHATASTLLLYRHDDVFLKSVAGSTSAQKISFSLNQATQADWYIDDGQFCSRHSQQFKVDTTQLPLAGDHNLLNALPSVILGQKYGLSPTKIETALADFQPLAHRLQLVAQCNQLTFINDSAGTTPEACMAALQAFDYQPIILLVGGSDKGADFTELGQAIAQSRVTQLLLLPSTGVQIQQAVIAADQNTKIQFHEIHSMPHAFEVIQQVATAPTTILLSPACASFSTFANYQDRGDQFSQAARAFCQKS